MFVDDEDDAQALEFARQELDLAAREEEFERQQAMFSAQQKWSPQVDRLVNEGKVYPSERANVLALLAQSEVANTTMEFEAADGKKQVSSAQFQFEILDRSKPKITYGEKTSVAADQDYDGSASFEVHAYAPSEFSIAPDAMTMHEDILATGVKPSDHNGYLAEYKKRSKQQRRKAG